LAKDKKKRGIREDVALFVYAAVNGQKGAYQPQPQPG
jgi:hypothetical protein